MRLDTFEVRSHSLKFRVNECLGANWDMQKKLVQECHFQTPAGGERGLARRLLKRVRILAEREFVGGKFLTPLALRYDNQDVSRYTVDKTCIFFSFPYFLVAKPALRKHFEKDDPRHPHPVRTLLQSHYRLHKTVDRDKDQSISLLKGGTIATSINASDGGRQGQSTLAVEDLVFVPQVWGIIDGLGMQVLDRLFESCLPWQIPLYPIHQSMKLHFKAPL